jgi:hypothetical protein
MNNLYLKADMSASKQRLFIQKSKSLLFGSETKVSENRLSYIGLKAKVCAGRFSEIKIFIYKLLSYIENIIHVQLHILFV